MKPLPSSMYGTFLRRLKLNTVKLVLDVELLKANYNELKDSLHFTNSQVDSLVTENIAVKAKLKLLKEEEEVPVNLT